MTSGVNGDTGPRRGSCPCASSRGWPAYNRIGRHGGFPTQSVNVGASAKQIEVEADLVLGGRPHVDRRPGRAGQGSLVRIGCSGLLFAQFEESSAQCQHAAFRVRRETAPSHPQFGLPSYVTERSVHCADEPRGFDHAVSLDQAIQDLIDGQRRCGESIDHRL
jgi:hypothetical protein